MASRETKGMIALTTLFWRITGFDLYISISNYINCYQLLGTLRSYSDSPWTVQNWRSETGSDSAGKSVLWDLRAEANVHYNHHIQRLVSFVRSVLVHDLN
jgi:hypothetical protein